MTIHYDNGDIEANVDMTAAQWNYSDTIAANSSTVSADLAVSSTEQKVLSAMNEHFGNKPFMKHQARGFEQYPLVNSYAIEEKTFLKTARSLYHRYVPDGANVIISHTLYKVKHNNDGTLKLKARKAPHGNEDDPQHLLNKDCSMCPPTGLRILESSASLFG